MKKNSIEKIKVELREAIESVFNKENSVIMRSRNGYVGNDTIKLMAEAALCVLVGVEEVQDYLKEDGLLED